SPRSRNALSPWTSRRRRPSEICRRSQKLLFASISAVPCCPVCLSIARLRRASTILGAETMCVAASMFYSTTKPEKCLDWRIRPSDEQYDTQKARWNDLADAILSDLETRSGYPTQHWLQGSYKFGTQVRPAAAGQEFDIDLGVYFKWTGL